jgi:hypothetical protein
MGERVAETAFPSLIWNCMSVTLMACVPYEGQATCPVITVEFEADPAAASIPSVAPPPAATPKIIAATTATGPPLRSAAKRLRGLPSGTDGADLLAAIDTPLLLSYAMSQWHLL